MNRSYKKIEVRDEKDFGNRADFNCGCCIFAADPTSIILPQTSTLSWSCAYADICSINQGVGSVNPISGTQEVRPSATTTYTLTCDGSDGERTWQSTVNVGFTPILREVAP